MSFRGRIGHGNSRPIPRPPARQWVTFWATSSYSNHGLCVRRLAGESTDLSQFLIPESVTAELVIVYRRR
ncbi:MAG: hypothetical protein SGI90_16325 [Candidatus Eisenbacteria bacterium]|nr:hypothetical protein [Candidatus Eisenbacteria bacterium]